MSIQEETAKIMKLNLCERDRILIAIAQGRAAMYRDLKAEGLILDAQPLTRIEGKKANWQ